MSGDKVTYSFLSRVQGELRRPPDPPDNGDMEARVIKLEQFTQETRDRLARIETRLDAFATKEDLQRDLHALTWKLIGACTVLVAAVYFVARTVH